MCKYFCTFDKNFKYYVHLYAAEVSYSTHSFFYMRIIIADY